MAMLRMNRRKRSNLLFLSLSEIAWIFVILSFTVLLWSPNQDQTGNGCCRQLDVLNEKYQALLKKIEEIRKIIRGIDNRENDLALPAWLDRLGAYWMEREKEWARHVAAPPPQEVAALQERPREITEDRDRQRQPLEEELQRLREQLQEDKQRVRRELLGLRGDFRKVVVLIDISGSLIEPGFKKPSELADKRSKWEITQGVLANWLDHLPFVDVAVVFFNDKIVPFPEDGSFLPMEGKAGKENRNLLLEQLRRMRPRGDTHTLQALEKAYSYEGVDTIILFTDGPPEDKRELSDKKQANSKRPVNKRLNRKVYELCKRHPDIPVNTVGIGHYFDPAFSDFLNRVANQTGGGFIGF